MELEYDIVIITTAVSRSDLHQQIFPKYLEFISDLKCYWLINIDQLEEGESVNDTKENILEICKSENITIEITTNKIGGTRESFYKSCQYLINHAAVIEPKYGYLWLEDDWYYKGGLTLFDILQSNEFNSMDYIQLVDRSSITVSFNPGLWGVDLFNKLCVPILDKPYSQDNANPERACTYPIKESNDNVDKFIHYILFSDAGRAWTANKGIWRTFQKS
jgi:hypothetical protein